MVEKAADKFVETRSGMKHVIVKNLGRHTMLKPSHAATLLPDQTFKLGDRVVFVQDSGTVPIGAKGTVVGIDRLEVEVVFDDKFMSGMDLSGRCSMYRGMTVGPQSILNLSNPQCNQKTPATAAPAAAAPRPKPVNILPKNNNQHNPTDDKPPGWDILGVAPVTEKPKKGPHHPKNHNNNHGNGGGRTLGQAPRGEQTNVNQNQSLGFHARPRPPVQIAVRPNSENNKPDAEDISALLLGILHKNVPADQAGGSGPNGVHGMSFGTLPPVLPAAGTQAAALLEHLRPRPPPQQHQNQHQHQQQPAPPPAWQDAGRIQQQHGQSSPQGQRGVQRHPRPPPANGQPQAGNSNNNQRPPGFSNRGGHRGGHSQGQPRPAPANQSQNQGQGQSGPSNGGGNGKANNNGQERGSNNSNRRGRGRGGNRGGNKGGDSTATTAPAAPAATSAEGSSSTPTPQPPAPAAKSAPAPSTQT